MSSYLSAFGEILLFALAGILFVSLALLVSSYLRPSRPNPEKLTPYESGEAPAGEAWVQFNIRYFVIAIVFLLFEVEIVFLFPWALVAGDRSLQKATDGLWGWFTWIEIVLFIAILAVGLAYVWRQGFLDWIKPRHATPEIPSPVPPSLYDALNERQARP